MIDERKKAFDNISRILAITRYDIEQHQSINDQSLNIHGENYFRDIFNFIYDYKLENANFESSNTPCVDLINKKRKLAYQITTTRTKEKIEKTLVALKKPEYNGFTIKIFFLLEKAKLQKETITAINSQFGVDIIDCLFDYTDLMKDIENLETNKLIELNKKYFLGLETKYTDVIVLNLIFRHLINAKSISKNKYYDDDFGSIDTNDKLKLNAINLRIAAKINDGLDYRSILELLDEKDSLLTDLRTLIVDFLYKNFLLDELSHKVRKSELENKQLTELHLLAQANNLDFNKIIYKLHDAIEEKIDIQDFNTMNIAWIIIAYFFELCDVGVHDDNAD